MLLHLDPGFGGMQSTEQDKVLNTRLGSAAVTSEQRQTMRGLTGGADAKIGARPDTTGSIINQFAEQLFPGLARGSEAVGNFFGGVKPDPILSGVDKREPIQRTPLVSTSSIVDRLPDSVQQPSVVIDPLAEEALATSKLVKPVAQGVARIVDSFTTPENLAILGISGGAGKIPQVGQALSAAGGAGFDAMMISQAIQAAPQIKQQFDAGDIPGAITSAVEMLAAGAMGAHGGAGKFKGMREQGGVTARPLEPQNARLSIEDAQKLTPPQLEQRNRELLQQDSPAVADVQQVVHEDQIQNGAFGDLGRKAVRRKADELRPEMPRSAGMLDGLADSKQQPAGRPEGQAGPEGEQMNRAQRRAQSFIPGEGEPTPEQLRDADFAEQSRLKQEGEQAQAQANLGEEQQKLATRMDAIALKFGKKFEEMSPEDQAAVYDLAKEGHGLATEAKPGGSPAQTESSSLPDSVSTAFPAASPPVPVSDLAESANRTLDTRPTPDRTDLPIGLPSDIARTAEAAPDPSLKRNPVIKTVDNPDGITEVRKEQLKSEIKAQLADQRGSFSDKRAQQVSLIENLTELAGHYIREGVDRFSQFYKRIKSELGETIGQHALKAWNAAKRLNEQLGRGEPERGSISNRRKRETAPVEMKQKVAEAGGGGRGGKVAESPVASPAPEPGGKGSKPPEASGQSGGGEKKPLVTSPSYDKTKPKILEHVEPEVRKAMEARLKDYEARNEPRKVVTHDEIREEARSLDTSLVHNLDASKLKAGDTLDPAVRFAAQETLNGLNEEIQTRRTQLADNAATWENSKRHEEASKLEKLEADAKRLIDVLIPTRSQDGRNLAYHAMMAKRSFDVTYWLSRARKSLAMPDGVDLPKEVDSGIRGATAAGAKAEREAVDSVQGPAVKSKEAVEAEATSETAKELGYTPEKVLEAAKARETSKRPDRTTPAKPKTPGEITREQVVAKARQSLLDRLDGALKSEKTPKVEPISLEERTLWEQDAEVIVRRAKLANYLTEKKNWAANSDTRITEVEKRRKAFVDRLKAQSEGKRVNINPVTPEEKALWENDPEVLAARAKIAKLKAPIFEPNDAQKIQVFKDKVLEKIAAKMKGEEPKPRVKSKWELTPAQRAQVDADPQVRASRIALAKQMMNMEKSGLLETINTLRRAGLLTSVRTHLRNFGGNTAFQAMEEATRLPAVVVDSALKVFTGNQTVAGPSLRAMARAGKQAATKGVREATEIMRTGTTEDQLAQMDMHRELNSGSKWLDTYANTVFRSMSAADRVFKIFAFERSLDGQMKLANTSKATEAMKLQAWADANFATFNNDNMASDLLSRGKTALKNYGEAGKLAAFGIDLLVPFQRTPANIVARVLDYTPAGSAVKGAFAVRKAMQAGGLTPELQRDLSMAIGRGAVGSSLMLLGYMLSQKGLMTGIASANRGERDVDEAAGRLPGAMLLAGVWRRLDSFSPLGNLLTLGATLEREQSKGPAAMVGIAGRTVMEQPMLQGANELVDLVKDPARSANRFTSSMAGSFVPSAVADLAAVGDSKRRDLKEESLSGSMAAAVANRVPGLRNTLNERIDVMGRGQRQELLSVVMPTVGSAAKEISDPVLSEMATNRVVMQKPNRPKDVPYAEYRVRQEVIGAEVDRRVKELIESDGYKNGDEEVRDKLISRNKIKATEGMKEIRREMIEAVISKTRSDAGSIIKRTVDWGELSIDEKRNHLQDHLAK